MGLGLGLGFRVRVRARVRARVRVRVRVSVRLVPPREGRTRRVDPTAVVGLVVGAALTAALAQLARGRQVARAQSAVTLPAQAGAVTRGHLVRLGLGLGLGLLGLGLGLGLGLVSGTS